MRIIESLTYRRVYDYEVKNWHMAAVSETPQPVADETTAA